MSWALLEAAIVTHLPRDKVANRRAAYKKARGAVVGKDSFGDFVELTECSMRDEQRSSRVRSEQHGELTICMLARKRSTLAGREEAFSVT